MVMLDELCLLIEVDQAMPDDVALALVADCQAALQETAEGLVRHQQHSWTVRIRLWDDID